MSRLIVRFVNTNWSLLVLAAILPAIMLSPPYADVSPMRRDGLGYHLWTYTILKGDLNFAPYAHEREAGIELADPQRGYFHSKYGPGVALIRLPVMCLLVDVKSPYHSVSTAEQNACQILSGVALLATVFFAMRCCRRIGAADWAANLSTLAIAFGTGLFNYCTYEAGYSHIWSALGLTILLDFAVKACFEKLSGLNLILMMCAAFLLVLVRNTNVVAIAFLGLLASAGQRRTGIPLFKVIWTRLVPLSAAAGFGLIVQIALNSNAHHRLSVSSYSQEHFVWDRPMLGSVLTSYNHGLFLYYPIFAIILACGIICRFTRRATIFYALLLLAYTALYGYWYSWWLAESFGHRGFVELSPLGAPILALLITRTNGAVRWALLLTTAVSVFATLELLAGYWRGSLPWEFISQQQYRSNLIGDDSIVRQLLGGLN